MSDSKSPQPRLMLPDNGLYQQSRIPELLHSMYELILAMLDANPDLSGNDALRHALCALHDDRPNDYLLLLSCWSQDDDEPPVIWAQPYVEVDLRFDSDRRLWYKRTEEMALRPFDDIDFNVEGIGETGFFLTLVSREGITSEEFQALLKALEQRDLDLGILEVNLDAERTGMIDGEFQTVGKVQKAPS